MLLRIRPIDELEETVIGNETDQNQEPPDPERVLSSERRPMTFEMIETSPAAPAGRTRLGRGIVIDDPDAELVQRWQGGDEAAFAELIERDGAWAVAGDDWSGRAQTLAHMFVGFRPQAGLGVDALGSVIHVRVRRRARIFLGTYV